MEIIIGREGDQPIPITDKTVSRKHCKVTPNGDGSYTLENLSGNGTYIDNLEIVRKTVMPDTVIRLGKSYKTTLKELLQEAKTKGEKESSKPAQQWERSIPQDKAIPSFSIRHLKSVWEEYEQTNLKSEERNRRNTIIRTGLGVFTMSTMLLFRVLGDYAFIFTGIGIVGNLYSFIGLKNSESPSERKERRENLEAAYVCPNPACRHSLPVKSYRMIVNDYVHSDPNKPSCPYCKCRFTE